MKRTALIEARLKKHWSQFEAAEAIGIDYNTLYRWEAGKSTPRGYNLRQLCAAYGMTAAELGLEPRELASCESKQITESVPVEESIFASLAEMSRPNESETSPYQVSRAVLALGLQHAGWTFEELQFRTEEELQKLDTLTLQQGKQTSRRDILALLSRLPAAIFSMTLIGSEETLFPEELLPLYITGIPACWRLYFSGDASEVGKIVPFYGSMI